MNYSDLAKKIVENVGTKENVQGLTHCVTRLRFRLHDEGKANTEELKKMDGVLKVIQSGGQYQVVIGNHVSSVYEEVMNYIGGISSSQPKVDDQKTNEKGAKKVLGSILDGISSIFSPILGAFTGAGMLKALLILATTLKWLDPASGTYTILYAASDAIFYFLPIALSITAAKYFKANQFVALCVGSALVYPTMTAAFSAKTAMSFAGIKVVLINYPQTLIPALAAVYALALLERLLNKVIPQMFKGMLVPLLSLVIIVPATFLLIGPVTDAGGQILAKGYSGLLAINPIIAGGAIALVWPMVVLMGMHWGFVPIVVNNLSVYGRDTLFTITGPNNFCQAAACLAVFLKTKNKKLKEIAGPAGITATLTGITEPAIYGVNLKYKKPFVIGCIFSGIAGGITAAVGAGTSAFVGTSLISLPAYIGKGFVGFLIACAIAFFGTFIVTYLFGFNDSMIKEEN